jgi:predicted transcriptional regulator of viral defense system
MALPLATDLGLRYITSASIDKDLRYATIDLMTPPSRDDVLEVIRRCGVARPRDLEAAGISRMWLTRLTRQGLVTRLGRGLYEVADADWTAHHSYAEVAKRVPAGIVCLLSALVFHDLTTQLPFEVWLAIDKKARVPRGLTVAVRLMRFSGPALTEGVGEHVIDGVTVRITSPARTVVDCFRYRNTVGLDVALEALRDCHELRLATRDDLWECAGRLRAANVMRPYLESLM